MALIAELITANTGVPVADIIGLVATAVATASNKGTVPDAVAQAAFAVAETRGGVELTASA